MASIELKFSGTFAKTDYLKEFSCIGCQQTITEQDILKSNYRLYVSDYANEVEKNLTTYGLNFWLKAVKHLECPEGEG